MIDSEQRNALIVYIVKDISIFFQRKENLFFTGKKNLSHIRLEISIIVCRYLYNKIYVTSIVAQLKHMMLSKSINSLNISYVLAHCEEVFLREQGKKILKLSHTQTVIAKVSTSLLFWYHFHEVFLKMILQGKYSDRGRHKCS